MIKYFILWWRLCLVVIDASLFPTPDTREVPDLYSVCARMDIWGFKWSCKSIMWRCWYLYRMSRKTSLQLFSLCTRRWRRYRLCAAKREMKSTTIEKKSELDTQKNFFPVLFLFTPISSSRLWNKSSTSQTSPLKKMICLADHPREKNSPEHTESILWLYLFGDWIISSEKRVHIRWITTLYVSAPNLPHSSVYFWLKQQNSLKSDTHPCQCETQIRYASSRSSSQLTPELKYFPYLNSSKRRKLPRLIHRSTNCHGNQFVAHSHSIVGSKMKMYSRQ